ncbi:hypothetical protein IW261DRAFT_1346390 [Armillaria novae-zelandiae]|uniref:Uncharacterized protein n=1 Tax=Armillaria novae-zelandiae TaxID=153914 RepID=A0AA39NKZ0_9AGAR|nr:hypothetical protein IW261DRAFT_1346390 [Armillaria novae-zelandiae]
MAEQVGVIVGNERALMLILDVCTCWSSTHQMMRCVLDYHDIVDEFVSSIRDFWDEELLMQDDWHAIELVTGWLKAFCVATTDMSTTRRPMLSPTHTIFHGLQSHLCDILCELPDDIVPQIKMGLIEAHRKLSDYYYKYDKSPLYTWAALLDLRVSYEGMLDDYADDETLLEYLESAKMSLRLHFCLHYANKSGQKAQPAPSVTSAPHIGRLPSLGSPQKINFTSRHNQKPKRSAVAVEHIFSGGHDTLSLQQASLKADTIHMLMLVKHRLHLAHTAVNELLGSTITR